MQGYTDPPRNALSEATVVDSLSWEHSPQINWGVDLLNTVTLADTGISVDVTSGSVSWRYRARPNPGDTPSFAVVRRTGSLQYRHEGGFNPLAVYWRPWVEMTSSDGTVVRWHLGVFTAALPPYSYEGLSDHEGPVVWRDLELADLAHLWQSDESADAITVSLGTDLVDWVKTDIGTRFNVADTSNIVGSGITADVDYVFDAGTPWLQIYSTLLQAAGNEPLYADQDGMATSGAVVDPASRIAEHTYEDGGTLLAPADVQPVNPDLPNAVRFIARNGPSLPEEGNGIRTVFNEDVGPGSRQQRGGLTILHVVEIDAQTQTELDEQARYWAPFYFAGGGLRYVGEVGLNPRHGDSDIVQLSKSSLGISGTWLVTGWTINLGEVEQMMTMPVEMEQLTGTAFADDAPAASGAFGTMLFGETVFGGQP